MNKKDIISIFRFLRILLGLLFICSGFVKCIDPIGGAIKIEDYFVAWGLNIPFSLDIALSFTQNLLEFITGFLLIFNLFIPISSLIALLFMCLFTPLTLYIAIFNPVSDCGCFGDAVKLTNWQTFFKNIIFLPIAIAVFKYRKKFKPYAGLQKQMAMSLVGIATALVIQIAGLTNEPLIDFRPYSVGTDINVAMAIPDDAHTAEIEITYILEKDGVQQEFSVDNYPSDTTWTYIDRKEKIISEGYEPPIKDFTFTNVDGDYITPEILQSTQPIMLAISPTVDAIDDYESQMLTHLADLALQNNFKFYIATSSYGAQLEQLDNKAQFGFDYLQADETMLRTITRSNPGIIIIQNGVIIAKYHINHLPYDKAFVNPQASYLTNIETQNARLFIISIIFAVGFVLIILYKYHKRK